MAEQKTVPETKAETNCPEELGRIPIFDGKEYECWKIRLNVVLSLKKCKDVVTRKKLRSDGDEWDEKDLRAVNIIYSAISNNQLQFIREETTAYDIIKKFDEMYLKQSTALQICIRNKLEKLRLKDFENSDNFFIQFEKSINELKSAGANITEKEKLSYMIKMLPSSLSYIGDLIDVLQDNEQTVEYVKSKIKMAEIKEKEEGFKTNTNVFKTERKQGKTCYRCGGYGHLIAQCTNKSNNSWRQRGAQQPGGGSQPGGSQPGGGMQGGGFSQQQQYRQSRGGYNRGRGASQQRGNWHQQRHFQGQSGGKSSGFYTEVKTSNESDIEVNSCDSKIDWLLDSGCSDHIINNDSYFYECVDLKQPVNVKVGDGRILKATKVGTVLHEFKVNGEYVTNKMSNVFFVKEMDKNLISYGKVTNKNKIVSFGNTSKIYDCNRDLVAVAYKVNDMYHMTSEIVYPEVNVSRKCNMTSKEKLHRTLGHVNFNYLKTMCNKQILDGLPKDIESEYMKCGICVENKMHNLPFENDRTRAKEILEIIHTDLNGPHQTTGLNGEKYFLSFIDDYSKVAKVFVINTKDEVCECFIDYVNSVESKTGKRVKRLRCDNGREYINKDIFRFAREKGIYIEPCPPYVHELNGTAEKYNRDIMDMARCLMAEANVHRRFWPEVIKTAAYLKNRIITNTVERNKTPFEIMFGEKPSVKHLKLYGSKVYVRVPEVKRNSKWDRKAKLGILLGYESVGYRVLINNKIIVARHVDIVEEGTDVIGLEEVREEEKDLHFVVENVNDQSECDSIVQGENENFGENFENQNENMEIRKSTRERRKPVKLRDENFVYNNIVYVNYVNAESPVSYEDAMNSDESGKWKCAMDKEMNSLVKNETWELCEKPVGKKTLDLKWVYTKKADDVYKARIVVRGYQQNDLIDDIYSPVARMQTLKILLSYCCLNNMFIRQLDVETAFLNGHVKSEVYVKQPQGYEDGTNRALKLVKALYGLRESPRAWYECFDKYLKDLNFIRSENDCCLYTLNDKNNKNNAYIILFVDDILICCKDKVKLSYIKNLLFKRFQMKDLGEINTYLGIDINYNQNEGKMTLSQSDYILSLAKKYNIENSKLYSTPMELNLKLCQANSCNDNIKYRNLIGALLYISSGTRPDISFCVNYLSRFQNCYDNTHYKYALRVLKYLYLTKDLKLTFSKHLNSEILECYVDADWAGDITDRKSTTGYIIKMYGNVIFWKSKKQNGVARSSTAAEYVALSDCVNELRLVKDILKDFDIEICKPIKIYEDNSGAINIAKFGNFTKNSKYIETHYHFVNENYINKVIDIVKVSSENNVADILTKALGRCKFEKFRSLLNVI